MSATDTPRTDKIAHRGYVAETYCAAMTDLARNLERELNEAKEACAMASRVHKLTKEAQEKTDRRLARAEKWLDALATLALESASDLEKRDHLENVAEAYANGDTHPLDRLAASYEREIADHAKS